MTDKEKDVEEESLEDSITIPETIGISVSDQVDSQDGLR